MAGDELLWMVLEGIWVLLEEILGALIPSRQDSKAKTAAKLLIWALLIGGVVSIAYYATTL